MQKKILIIALCLLAVVFLTVACNKNKEPDKDYVPIDYTVGEDGEKYVTNIYGDLIPVTTSKDGGMELIDDLYTKKLDQVDSDGGNGGNGNNGDNGDNGNNGGNGNNGNNGNNSNNSGGINVGTDDIRNNDDRDAVIVW